MERKGAGRRSGNRSAWTADADGRGRGRDAPAESERVGRKRIARHQGQPSKDEYLFDAGGMAAFKTPKRKKMRSTVMIFGCAIGSRATAYGVCRRAPPNRAPLGGYLQAGCAAPLRQVAWVLAIDRSAEDALRNERGDYHVPAAVERGPRAEIGARPVPLTQGGDLP